jgi:hypothetical protein
VRREAEIRPPAAVSATETFCLWEVKYWAILVRIGSKEGGGKDIFQGELVEGIVREEGCGYVVSGCGAADRYSSIYHISVHGIRAVRVLR